jgi:hypothetical protein
MSTLPPPATRQATLAIHRITMMRNVITPAGSLEYGTGDESPPRERGLAESRSERLESRAGRAGR